jgi:hypothetical protein
MSRLRLRLDGDPGTISFDVFVGTLRDSLTALRDLDSAISKQPEGTLRWAVDALHTDSLVTDVRAIGDGADRVTGAYVDGVRTLEDEATIPPYFSEDGLKAIRRIARRIGQDGATGYRAIELDREAEARVTEVTEAHIKAALVPRFESVGSVTGTLEMISVHKTPRTNVYDALTHRAVRCTIPKDERQAELLEEVKAQLGRRVIASGRVFRNMAGDAIRVRLRSITPLPDNADLPGVDEIVGLDPEFTGDMTTEEYMRHLRDA